MTYRTKLFAMLLALVAVTGGLLTWANYVKSTGLLQEDVHRKARSIASTTAALLDPDAIKALRGRSDETRAEYAQLRAQLRAVRDANRREDVWVERTFTLVPAPENPNIVEYGVDTAKSASSTCITWAISTPATACPSRSGLTVSTGSPVISRTLRPDSVPPSPQSRIDRESLSPNWE